MIRYDSLLQNATDILLQNATVVTNYDDFITKCGSYYKMQRLLQSKRQYTAIICEFNKFLLGNAL